MCSALPAGETCRQYARMSAGPVTNNFYGVYNRPDNSHPKDFIDTYSGVAHNSEKAIGGRLVVPALGLCPAKLFVKSLFALVRQVISVNTFGGLHGPMRKRDSNEGVGFGRDIRVCLERKRAVHHLTAWHDH